MSVIFRGKTKFLLYKRGEELKRWPGKGEGFFNLIKERGGWREERIRTPPCGLGKTKFAEYRKGGGFP